MAALIREDSSPNPGSGSGSGFDAKPWDKALAAADPDADAGSGTGMPRGRSAWFGGTDVQIGPRIGPILSSISSCYDSDESSSAILDKQVADEEGHSIQYRTCSWYKVRPLSLVVPCTRSRASLLLVDKPDC